MNSELFPLRLTPFEELFYFDDFAECPSTMFCLVTFDGAVDCTIARRALEQTCQRHPLLASRIEPGRNGTSSFSSHCADGSIHR